MSLPRVVRAEALRWRRDVAAWLPLGGVVVGAGLGVLSSGVHTGSGWGAVLAWLNPWAVFVGPMLAVLVVGVSVTGDRACRGGGTWWRPVDALRADVAKLAVAAVFLLAMDLLAVMGVLGVGATHADGVLPALRVLGVVVVLWSGSLCVAAVGLRVARRLGVLAALGVGAVWCVIGALAAESRVAWFIPPAWAVRATIPLLGTHANGVRLPRSSALQLIQPFPLALACILLAVAIVVVRPPQSRPSGVPQRAGHRRPTDRVGPGAPAPLRTVDDREHRTEPVERAVGRRAVRPSAAGAVAASLRRTPMWILPAASLALCLLMTRWQSPDRVLVIVPVLVAPVVAFVAPMALWGRQRPAWRAIASRTVPIERIAGALALMNAVLAAISVVVPLVVLSLLAGARPPRVLLIVGLGCLTVLAVSAWQLVLEMSVGRVVALAVGIVGTFGSLLIGGSGLGTVFWIVDPWSWGAFGSPAQTVVTVPVMLVALVLAWFAIARCGRRAAA
ncbi:hypothetical protein [Curtobacterium sp. VKM Ac-2922]|uniref:hypothetical protein n=1 Tax=Curtobacterium sp. VKM Ac-2922 TaxID=2929475 RepID=UPI001FB39E36|nr:hypothetical protein [Curtobacterium sp. VKM Ac-2922]MCJ1712941.1 hypothetical protein [Curtobacterium sp. VKM Ac-2922]